MPQVNLKGKTVMIVTTERLYATGIKILLQKLGANVVFSSHLPLAQIRIQAIGDEVEQHEPKIDALILHNSNIERPESQTVALELVHRLEKLPVIVCDACDEKAIIQSLRDAGATYLNFLQLKYEQIAFAVVEAVAQHGKSGREADV